MATNLALDDNLIKEAQLIGGHKTKREMVTNALKEYILRRKQKKILDLFERIDWEENYDYKTLRKP